MVVCFVLILVTCSRGGILEGRALTCHVSSPLSDLALLLGIFEERLKLDLKSEVIQRCGEVLEIIY